MTRNRKSKRIDFCRLDIPSKANRILRFISFAFFIIIIRIWYLAVVMYDHHVAESQKPQKKTIIEPAVRSTIRDRFNIPLASNKIQYRATVLYSQIKDIPAVAWERDASGKKSKKFRRREYISRLSRLLADELKLDPERLEDLIHSKASYYSSVPFLIKDELTEKEYYRLKMLEKDWPGIYACTIPKRHYPLGSVGADIIGYMGAINKREYEKILHEMNVLEQIARKSEEEDPELPPGIESIDHARKRLRDLEEKTYTSRDYIGKTGIEGVYEKQLRGFYGKKFFYSDSKGHFLRELPGSRPPLSGYRILLTISAELQEYAEQLLAQNEAVRLVRLSHLGAVKKTILAMKHPWIKGGAIVVMEPHTGEVLALASYPRFDPNDFIASGDAEKNKVKNRNINRWFENEQYLADVWNLRQPWQRERFDHKVAQFYDEKALMSWKKYLGLILPVEGPLQVAVSGLTEIRQAIEVQETIENLLSMLDDKDLYSIFNLMYNGAPHIPYHPNPSVSDKRSWESLSNEQREAINKSKKNLHRYFSTVPNNYDKVLLVDICRLAVDHRRFSPELRERMGRVSLVEYKESMCSLTALIDRLKDATKKLFHDTDFKAWRKAEEKEFLKKKRIEEKNNKSYPKPYLDYLDSLERQSFRVFWDRYGLKLLATFLTGYADPELSALPGMAPYTVYFTGMYEEMKKGTHRFVDGIEAYVHLQQAVKDLPPRNVFEYLKTMRSYDELNRPLLGRYRGLRGGKMPTEKNLAAAFYPLYGFGYGRSYAYRQAAIQGSIFKVVTAYEALVQNFRKLNRKEVSLSELNPLVITDQVFERGSTTFVGYTQDGKPIPQLYKGGRIPRSLARQNNGEVDLIKALEVSSNPYFSLLACECMENPEDLPNAARLFSFGRPTGIDLPGEISGKIPDDASVNRTGLYSLAIGQHTLVVTPLQTAVMLSAVANGGKVLKPKIVQRIAGRQRVREEGSASSRESDFGEEIAFSRPAGSINPGDAATVIRIPTEIKRHLFMPPGVRAMLLKGLQAGCRRTYRESLTSLSRLYYRHPEAIDSFTELQDRIIGKTSTSESVEVIDLDLAEGRNMYTHVWFGSIAFRQPDDRKGHAFIFKDEFGEAEVVVVVYLRYGGYGKEAAPLAAQMVKKWHELKKKYASAEKS